MEMLERNRDQVYEPKRRLFLKVKTSSEFLSGQYGTIFDTSIGPIQQLKVWIKFRANLRTCFSLNLLHVFLPLLLCHSLEPVSCKGLVGKLPGNPASCPEEPCNSDPQHVLYALKWTSLGFGIILLLPLLMYYLSKLISKINSLCSKSRASEDLEKNGKDKSEKEFACKSENSNSADLRAGLAASKKRKSTAFENVTSLASRPSEKSIERGVLSANQLSRNKSCSFSSFDRSPEIMKPNLETIEQNKKLIQLIANSQQCAISGAQVCNKNSGNYEQNGLTSQSQRMQYCHNLLDEKMMIYRQPNDEAQHRQSFKSHMLSGKLSTHQIYPCDESQVELTSGAFGANLAETQQKLHESCGDTVGTQEYQHFRDQCSNLPESSWLATDRSLASSSRTSPSLAHFEGADFQAQRNGGYQQHQDSAQILSVSRLYQQQNSLAPPSNAAQHRHSIDGSILNNMAHNMQPGLEQVNKISDMGRGQGEWAAGGQLAHSPGTSSRRGESRSSRREQQMILQQQQQQQQQQQNRHLLAASGAQLQRDRRPSLNAALMQAQRLHM